MKSKLFVILLVTIAFIGVSLFTVTARAEQKIAIVSLQSALNQVNEGKRAMSAIQSEIAAKKKQLDGLKSSLKKMRDDLEKKKMVLSKEALEKKGGELQAKFLDLQKKALQYDQELKKKESASIQKILKALKMVVIDIAKKEKYDMVYENSTDTILYSTNAVDITSSVIKRYNRKHR